MTSIYKYGYLVCNDSYPGHSQNYQHLQIWILRLQYFFHHDIHKQNDYNIHIKDRPKMTSIHIKDTYRITSIHIKEHIE